MMYNDLVLDCFFSPHHIGVLDSNQDLSVFVKNNQKGQGFIECYMLCRQDAIIQKVCFKTNGNPYLIAGLEWIFRQLEGVSIDKVPQIDYQLLIKKLDIPVGQYPVALRIIFVLNEMLVLMKNKLACRDQHV